MTASLGAAIWKLATRPDLRRLAETPDRVGEFVEEMLRFEAPVPNLPRVTNAEVTIGGVLIPENTLVWLSIGAANREGHDPRLRGASLGEGAPPHRAFGSGPHRCLGSHLARLELRLLTPRDGGNPPISPFRVLPPCAHRRAVRVGAVRRHPTKSELVVLGGDRPAAPFAEAVPVGLAAFDHSHGTGDTGTERWAARYTTIEAPMIRNELLRLLGMILFAALVLAAALFVVAHLGVSGNAIVG